MTRRQGPGQDRQHQDRRRRGLTASEVDLGVVRQRALLVGVALGGASPAEAEASLDELAQLVDTAGADPVDQVLQRRESPDPATLVGKGKLEELKELGLAYDVDLVVVDVELTPAQQRNLEKAFGCDVVDRVALILDIFAQHAHSSAGMHQVELAQLRYRLPRLRGRGVEMSRLGGGIGTRGPGETQLEVDRRRILRRIAKLEQDLVALARTRDTQRKARRRAELPVVALVGYTNAGKSTLLNSASDADVHVEDRLFSTLDPTTRRVRLADGGVALVSDTVGFVKKLPHQVVEAFRSTLEEVIDADLLVHVADGSSREVERQISAVRAVLGEIGAGAIPEIVAVNKGDIADPADVAALLRRHEGSVAISAATGEGVDDLLEAVARRLRAASTVVDLLVPYDRGDVLAALHREGEVLVETHAPEGTHLRVRLRESERTRFSAFTAGVSSSGVSSSGVSSSGVPS